MRIGVSEGLIEGLIYVQRGGGFLHAHRGLPSVDLTN